MKIGRRLVVAVAAAAVVVGMEIPTARLYRLTKTGMQVLTMRSRDNAGRWRAVATGEVNLTPAVAAAVVLGVEATPG